MGQHSQFRTPTVIKVLRTPQNCQSKSRNDSCLPLIDGCGPKYISSWFQVNDFLLHPLPSGSPMLTWPHYYYLNFFKRSCRPNGLSPRSPSPLMHHLKNTGERTVWPSFCGIHMPWRPVNFQWTPTSPHLISDLIIIPQPQPHKIPNPQTKHDRSRLSSVYQLPWVHQSAVSTNCDIIWWTFACWYAGCGRT